MNTETIDAAVTSLRSLIASNTTLRNQRNDTRAEVTKLKAALALGQENCDAEYDELREERDEARAQLAVALTAANAEELRQAQAELAALRQDKARLDWVEDFFARNTERSIIRQQFARDLRSIGFRAAINVAMKEVRHG